MGCNLAGVRMLSRAAYPKTKSHLSWGWVRKVLTCQIWLQIRVTNILSSNLVLPDDAGIGSHVTRAQAYIRQHQPPSSSPPCASSINSSEAPAPLSLYALCIRLERVTSKGVLSNVRGDWSDSLDACSFWMCGSFSRFPWALSCFLCNNSSKICAVPWR